MDERDERAAAVAEPVARLVLMAMARFTNPNRDQVYGPTREWRCWASVATIAEMAGASERQVQRVLRVFEREGYIDRIDQGQRPGRPRKGEEPGRAKPSTWCLRPDQWRRRALTNRTGVVAISSDQRNSLPVPVEVATTPVGLPGNGAGTGREGAEIVPVLSPEPGTPGTHNSGELINQPARAVAHAPSPIGELKTDDRANGHQGALFPILAVDHSAPMRGVSEESSSAPPVELPESPPAALRRPCPECQQLVGSITGKGHSTDCWRVGVPAGHPWFNRPRAEIEAQLAHEERSKAREESPSSLAGDQVAEDEPVGSAAGPNSAPRRRRKQGAA